MGNGVRRKILWYIKIRIGTHLEARQIPVLDIDVQGAIHVQNEYPVNSLFIFIEPPSIEELKKGLKAAAQKLKNRCRQGLTKHAYELSFTPV